MYNQFLDAGTIREDAELWTNGHYMQRAFDTPETTAQELIDFAYLANLECNFLNNVNKVGGQYQKAIEIFKDIVIKYPFHIIGWYCMMECYEKLGMTGEARRMVERIRELIKTDKRAIAMYRKYSYLMPAFNGEDATAPA
jgi:tetratricopeptide (TPR) repeat protein